MSIRVMADGKRRRSVSIRSRVTDGFLSIVATRTPPVLKAVLFNNEYTPGILTTQRNPRQGAGRHRRLAGILDARR